MRFSQIGSLFTDGKAVPGQVNLDDINTTPLDEFPPGVYAGFTLPGGNRDVRHLAQLPVTVEVILCQRLLQPERAVLFELPAAGLGRPGIPAAAGINENIVLIAGTESGALNQLHIQLFILAHRFPAELHRGKALRHPSLRLLASLLAVISPEVTGISPDSLVKGSSQQLVNRLPVVLAGNIPQRDVNTADGVGDHRPTTIVEAPSIHFFIDNLDIQRVHPDEQPPQPGDIVVTHRRLNNRLGDMGRRVYLADAHNPLIGRYPDNARVLGRRSLILYLDFR